MSAVSVVIPAYNAARFIREAVDSALGQSGVGVEVIVVDDGSSDDTWEILGSYGPAVRRFRQANAGPAAARNRGASAARGEWLAFLDADDAWEADKLARQLAAAGPRDGMVYTDCVYRDAVSGESFRPSERWRLHEGSVFRELLLGNFVTLSSAVIRKAAFDALGGFEPSLSGAEDWDLWLRLVAAGWGVRLVPEPLTRYRIVPGSHSKNVDKAVRACVRTVRRALAAGPPVPRRLARQALANVFQWSAWDALSQRERLKALGRYVRAGWCSPFWLAPYKGVLKCCLPAG